MELHKKYRPSDFKEIIGNKPMINSITAALDRQPEDIPHSWLFMGQKGSGKTTSGRILAEKLLGCSIEDCPDFIQLDGGDVKADVVKEIKTNMKYKPSVAKCRVFLIEEAHMVGSGGASEKNIPQNNLLTTLEEPPAWVYFILCTTDPQRLISTIHDRCHTYRVNPLNDKEMTTLINRVLKAEDVSDFPKKAIDAILDIANGAPRTALKILDQVIDLEDDSIIEAIESYRPIEAEIIELCQSVAQNGSWSRTIEIINGLKKNGENAEQVRRSIIGYITKIALNPQKKNKRSDEDPMVRLTDVYEALKNPTYANDWGDIVFPLFELTI